MISSLFGSVIVGVMVVVPLITAQRVLNYGQCITAEGENGLCVQLAHCSVIYNMLQKPRLTEQEKTSLRRSQCGQLKGTVLVCCADRVLDETSLSVDTRLRTNLPEPGVCGKVLSDRIFGGDTTKLDEFPWMALIEFLADGISEGHNCAGSLINERYILTAAHCMASRNEVGRSYVVRLGEWNTATNPDCQVDIRGNEDCADPSINVPVEKVIVHQNFSSRNKNHAYDIALLRLSRTVTYTDFIQPICLPSKPERVHTNFDRIVMDITGWGRTEQSSISNIKLKASVTGIPLSECQLVFNQQNVTLATSQICAGGMKGIDSCRGDSGGPLIALDTSSKARIYYFIAGIISFGTAQCGLQGWPSVYTKVSDYMDWIQDNMEQF